MGGVKMGKYTSVDAYILHELETAQNRNRLYEDDMFKAAQEIRSLRAQITNQNQYIIELEEKLRIKGDV